MGSPVVLGFVEGVLGDGNNIAVLSVGKKFETPITAHPALVGTTIGEMAWGEFSVSINGVEQIVGLSPDLFANGQHQLVLNQSVGLPYWHSAAICTQRRICPE